VFLVANLTSSTFEGWDARGGGNHVKTKGMMVFESEKDLEQKTA
jgi:hypothetical protein